MSETTTDPTSTGTPLELTPAEMSKFIAWQAEQDAIAEKAEFASMTLQITWLGMDQPTAPEGWTGDGYLVRAQNGRPIAAIDSWAGVCRFMLATFEAHSKPE